MADELTTQVKGPGQYTTVPKGMMYITIHKEYWIFMISVIHYDHHETTRLYEMIEYTW